MAADLVEEVVRDVRRPVVEKLSESVFVRNADLTTPAFMQFILRESRGTNIFDTAAQIRRSKEATDFRMLCRRYLEAMERPNYDLEEARELHLELDRAKAYWLEKLRMRSGSRDMQVGILGIGTTISIPDRSIDRQRPAFMFLYRIVKASYGLPLNISPTDGNRLRYRVSDGAAGHSSGDSPICANAIHGCIETLGLQDVLDRLVEKVIVRQSDWNLTGMAVNG